MKSLMTAAPVIDTPPNWIPTGNLKLSIPGISREDAGVYRLGILREDANSLIDLVGDEKTQHPLVAPVISEHGKRLALQDIRWERKQYWIPQFKADLGNGISVQGTVSAADDLAGMVYLLEVVSEQTKPAELEIGWEGLWKGVEQVVFSSREVCCEKQFWQDPWTGSLVGEASSGMPLIAWALQFSEEGKLLFENNSFTWSKSFSVSKGHPARVALYLAINLERDGARTSALHLRRVGYEDLLSRTEKWLSDHTRRLSDVKTERLLNENLFFNFFYSQGICLDSEALVLVTSRSNQYYVCAAFWARDAFLWSLPALALVDRGQAGRALSVGLIRYREHCEEHALYLNGRPLYPGFELDEACAPLIGTGMYAEISEDHSVYDLPEVQEMVDAWERKISYHFDPHLGLYDTFLTPHDDPTDHPFITVNNVLVWKAVEIAAKIYAPKSPQKSVEFRQRAESLKKAINHYCVFQGCYGRQYAGAIDGDENPEWIDFPGCSLTLLPCWGFCSADDEVYSATGKWIYSGENPYYYFGDAFQGVGSAHFPYPSSFDLANRLLCGDEDAFAEALQLTMDQGLACESFDQATGIVRTGAAFATGAGFLAQGIYHYARRKKLIEGSS